ncbi:MAG: endonuclease III [Planctomycetes bacterium RIFCSPHIGHO2_02_FULL_50_42]|nr:MAG: endonuclease III [Planctomycetes bacterium GWA2_50_13]OHB87226.1 MAG: endonuclease III [Planctomycetes bacterium RIFCSPHIGHO2_02_FULL_50_42]OHB96303.1 MAG: endonuclease III [Planctomycetes bacterium RIFCSPLOWO2_02_FULL_50_16]OHC04566.1 MAG: endonuclease III [Planctomycetes bacterium RIFCSPLOWO2_12_FULL_50_35]
MSKTDCDLQKVITTIKRVNRAFKEPTVTTVARGRDPFKVLISCLLSLRTKDNVTSAASERLFRLADTPDAMLKLETLDIQGAIYPVGFYRIKSARIKEICRALIEEYGRNVPDDIDTLLKLPGVGRKTANLVVTLGYGKPGICVDTHVHRITNRWGYVRTKTPIETEFALRKILPKKYWLIINDVLVTYGQNICTPVLPKCSICKVYWYCKRVGVKKHR